jgi:hypothetical protein
VIYSKNHTINVSICLDKGKEMAIESCGSNVSEDEIRSFQADCLSSWLQSNKYDDPQLGIFSSEVVRMHPGGGLIGSQSNDSDLKVWLPNKHLWSSPEGTFYPGTLVLVVDDHSSSFRRLAALISTVDDFSLASTYYF